MIGWIGLWFVVGFGVVVVVDVVFFQCWNMDFFSDVVYCFFQCQFYVVMEIGVVCCVLMIMFVIKDIVENIVKDIVEVGIVVKIVVVVYVVLFEGCVVVLIVGCMFLGISQDFICFFDFFKFGFSFFIILVVVWVIFYGQVFISFFDFMFFCCFGNV